ncbi:hypothetical protein ERJ75_000322000 [Trypanosoma vivax]|nr:hypothetical protein TRVL_01334 [Trypanosoma vivax]KAH8618016.1 hypothetical protein ERJ75_000322000 [Trypanosoma vivax]
MTGDSLLTVHDLVLGSTAVGKPSYVPLSSSLHLRMQYSVVRPVVLPRWGLTFVADVAYKQQRAVLLPPARCVTTDEGGGAGHFRVSHSTLSDADKLPPNAVHEISIFLEKMDVTSVEEKYLLHVGVLELELFSECNAVASVKLVVQVKKSDSGEVMRLVMNPLL